RRRAAPIPRPSRPAPGWAARSRRRSAARRAFERPPAPPWSQCMGGAAEGRGRPEIAVGSWHECSVASGATSRKGEDTVTILVTAATGNIGRPLVERLLAAGYRVRALTRDPARPALPTAAEDLAGRVADAPTLRH